MTPVIVLSQRLYLVRTTKLYKKEIVSIIEEYSWVSYDVTEVTGGGGVATVKQNTVIRVSRLFVLCISLVFGGNTWNFV